MAFRNFLTKNLPVKHDEERQPMSRLQREMNRVFDNFFDDFRLSPFEDRETGLFPKLDIKETKKAVEVMAELPGMESSDIDIRINDNILTLRGEKRQENKKQEENYYHMECAYGAFNRSIPLPAEVESDDVKAEFRNGILRISMRKKPEEKRKARKIEIKST